MHGKKIRRQIRVIAEAMDDEPKMYGIRVIPGKNPIDQLIQYCQQNLIKWDWNNNKFIKAMRDVYHQAGKTVPSNKEQLVQELQKESEQQPKLIDQLIAGLGGMSRRTFMGLSAGAGAGLATGMVDFTPHEKGQVDKTLRAGQHYQITYRNWRNQTRVFKDLIYHSSNGHMYWFMDPRRPRQPREYVPGSYGRQMRKEASAPLIKRHQENVDHYTAILNGQKPLRFRRGPDPRWAQTSGPGIARGYKHQGKPIPPGKQIPIYVQPHWEGTIERLRRVIGWHKHLVEYYSKHGTDYEREMKYIKESPYKYLTLQVENVVDITPLNSK